MSWANRLIETYDNYFLDGVPQDDDVPLVPVGFVGPKKIGIRVNLDRDGLFSSAQILEREIYENIPSTPEAEGRVGQAAPYPLSDEIRYTAGDLSQYSEENNKKKYDTYFKAYISQLQTWIDTTECPDELLILFHYISKKTLVNDLINSGLIQLDNKRLFPAKYLKTFVSFSVFDGDSAFLPIVSLDSVIESWQTFVKKTREGASLSYINGGFEPAIYNHAKIEGNAKLISQKDAGQVFQFKGRFETSEQAYAVSYSDSAKVSNTIRWLKDKGAFKKYGLTFLTWSTKAKEVIPPLDEDEPEEIITYTAESYSKTIRDKMAGIQNEVQYDQDSTIVLMGLETATPGRMSVTYYEEFGGKQYLAMLEKWYTHCSWILWRNHKDDKKLYRSYATPTPFEIGSAVLGDAVMITASKDKRWEKTATKLVKKLYNDLVICIVNGRAVPAAYTLEAYRRVCNPYSFTNHNGEWQRINWEKCIAITLAMLKSSFQKEDYQVALDKECADRSYLYGRLAAVADVVETRAISGSDSGWRQTNAIRYFGALQQRPAVTWQTIETKLIPYYKQLREKGKYLARLTDEIYLLGKPEEMSINRPLSPKFLEGYHNQRYELTTRKENYNE